LRYPNFFIVGAARSGTTFLWWQLKRNPSVFMPEDELNKEPAYFSDKNKKLNFQSYLELFKHASSRHKLIGEASTAYLTDPKSAERIRDFNPHAKIIIILRNPAERAYSLYNWMVQEGYEYSISFERALILEKRRSKKTIPCFWEPEYYWNYMYFTSGLYFEQVRRYIDLFNKNVCVVTFDDLKNDLTKTYSKICFFLKIDQNEIIPIPQNPSLSVYHPWIQFFVRKINSYYLMFKSKVINKKISTKRKRDRLLNIFLLKNPPSPLSPELKNLLMKRYQKNIIKLNDLVKDINLSCWINCS
jgi:hypothetical protein